MKKSTRKKRLCLFSLLVTLFVSYSTTGLAKTVESAKGIGFSYRNMVPDNQIGEGNYFDLLVKPGQKQTLVTEIRNDSQESITIKVSVADAKTTETGLIEFGPSDLKNTKGLKVKLTELLEGPKEIKLKKGESKQLKMVLTIPKKSFEGMILGGIELQKVTKDKPSQNKVKISNQYVYVYSISLRESKDGGTGKPAMSENDSSFVIAGGQGKAKASFNNDTPTIVRGMTVESYVTSKESAEVLAENKLTDMKMAPYSQLDFAIPLINPQAGSYLTHTKVTLGNQEWKWDKPFEITQKETAEKATYAHPEKKAKISFAVVIMIVVAVIIGTAVIYAIIWKITQYKRRT